MTRKNIVVATDSFKGCLDTFEAADAIARGLLDAAPTCKVTTIGVADGGEGTAKVLGATFMPITTEVCGPIGEPVKARWHFDTTRLTAYIDMSAAAGLPLVPEEMRSPMHTTTFGVGQLIEAAMTGGARKIVLGLGGSATNEAALGALQALGAQIICTDGATLPSPTTGKDLAAAERIEIPSGSLLERLRKGAAELLLACDVTATFTGPEGAVAVFSAQKGASPEEMAALEKGMVNIRRIIGRDFGTDLDTMPGSGAAGGCGGTLAAIAGGRIASGAELLLEAIGFDTAIAGADIVITGEGSADRQTLKGKIPYVILKHCRSVNPAIITVLAAGRVHDSDLLARAGFHTIIDINDGHDNDSADCMNPAVASARLSEAAARFISGLEKKQ